MRRLRVNLASTYAVYAASVLSGVVVTPIVFHALGTSGYGLWAFISAITVYLALLDLGIGPAVVRYAAEYRGRNAPEEINALASVALVLAGAIAAATAAVGVALAFLVPELISIPDELVWPARIATLVVVGGEAIRFPLVLFANVLAGQQRYDVINFASLVSIAVYSVLVVALLTQTGGLVLVSLLAFAAAVIRLAIPVAWIRRELPAFRLSRSLVTRARARELLSTSVDNLLIRIAGRLALSSDVVVVGIIFGAREAAFFAIAAKLWGLAFGLSISGTTLLYPAYAELEGSADEARQRFLLRGGLRAGVAIALLFGLPLLLLPEQLLEAWIGVELDPSVPVLVVLVLALFVHQPVHLLSQYLIARGRQRPIALISIPIAVANLLLSIVFAYVFGIWGVALGTLVTEAIALAVVPVFAARVSGISIGGLARAALRPVLPALALAVPILFFGGRLYEAENLLFVAPIGLLWVALFVPVVWRFGFDRHEREALGRKLLARPAPLVEPSHGGA